MGTQGEGFSVNQAYDLLELSALSIVAGIAIAHLQWAALPIFAAVGALWLACKEGREEAILQSPSLSRRSVFAIVLLGIIFGINRKDISRPSPKMGPDRTGVFGGAPGLGHPSKHEKIVTLKIIAPPQPTYDGWRTQGLLKGEKALVFGLINSEVPIPGDQLVARCTKRKERPWICTPMPQGIVHRQDPGIDDRIHMFRFELIKIFSRAGKERGARSAAALTSGAKALIAPVDVDTVARLGLLHLWAISGLHVLLLAGASSWGLSQLWTRILPHRSRPAPKVVGALGALSIVGLYTGLVGASPSAVRASLAFGIFVMLNLARRKAVGRHVFVLTCAMELSQNTAQIIQVGSLLSHAAVAGIIFMFPQTSNSKPPTSPGLIRFLKSTWLAGIAATSATAPITAHSFSAVTPAGIILGMLWVPLISFIVLPACLLIAGLHLIGVPTEILKDFAELPATAMEFSWTLLDSLDHPKARVTLTQGWALALGPLALFFLGAFPNPRISRSSRRSFQRAVLILTVISVPIMEHVDAHQRRGTEIIALNVGHGDAYVLRLESGETILIDAGPGYPDGTRTPHIARRLRRLGIKAIDLVIITHRHKDHFGGLARIIKDMPVRRCIRPGAPADIHNKDWIKLKESMLEQDLKCEQMTTENTISAANYQLEILYPTKEQAKGTAKGENGNSMIARITTRDGYLWITGDSPKLNERIAVGMNPTIFFGGIMLVPHHGSRTSSSKELLESFAPEAAMVSHGKKIPPGIYRKYISRRIPMCGTYPEGRLSLRLYRGFTFAPMGCLWERNPRRPTRASNPSIGL